MFHPEDFFKRTGIQLTEAGSLDASAVTPAVYQEWRAPRYGKANPERMTNPLWEWLIRTGINAYQATNRFHGPSPFDSGPAWCFERFGQSVTVLPDGRRVFIAGEHEDYYDPDFHIYNDVVIWSPDGRIEVLGYPRAVFPPTDFHSATLLEDAIVIIGNVGYPEHRQVGKTQVARLSLADWSISLIETHGECPSWLNDHEAEWDEARKVIRLTKGKISPPGGTVQWRGNFDEWELDPSSWQWTRSRTSTWVRREIHRVDKKRLELSLMNSILSMYRSQMKFFERCQENQALAPEARVDMRHSAQCMEKEVRELEARGVNLDLLQSLYRPSLPHSQVEESAEVADFSQEKRIMVDRTTIRYVDESDYIQMVVEGDLPDDTVHQLAEDFRAKLELIQGVPCQVSQLR